MKLSKLIVAASLCTFGLSMPACDDKKDEAKKEDKKDAKDGDKKDEEKKDEKAEEKK